jgi:hypothetical protein
MSRLNTWIGRGPLVALGIVIGLLMAMPVVANTQPASSAPPTAKSDKSGFWPALLIPDETFATLKRKRRVLTTAVESGEAEIQRMDRELTDLVIRAEDDRRQLSRAAQDLKFLEEQLEKRRKPGFKFQPLAKNARASSWYEYVTSMRDVAEVERERQQRLDEKAEIESRVQRTDALRTELKVKRSALPAQREELLDLEEEISDLLDVTRSQYLYRAGVSLVFAAIVYFLVLKFFRVVDSNGKVKESIFTGDSGMQFITLFSIVIAVILFGILGILQANELSALLGGLSGYILGKAGPLGQPKPDAAGAAQGAGG